MELAQILMVLWRRKLWLALVVLLAAAAAIFGSYRVSWSPPGIHQRTQPLGAASASFLVDSSTPAIVDLGHDLAQLAVRASVLAKFMQSRVIVQQIAAIAKIPANQISATGPLSSPNGQQPAQARAAQLATGGAPYSLFFDAADPTTTQLPIVTVYAQAATPAAAIRLADAAVAAVSQYITTQENGTGVPVGRRLVIHQLGPATGGAVGTGISRVVTVVIFLGAVLLGCLLILFASNLGARWRQLRVAERPASPVEMPTEAPPNGSDRDLAPVAPSSAPRKPHA